MRLLSAWLPRRVMLPLGRTHGVELSIALSRPVVEARAATDARLASAPAFFSGSTQGVLEHGLHGAAVRFSRSSHGQRVKSDHLLRA